LRGPAHCESFERLAGHIDDVGESGKDIRHNPDVEVFVIIAGVGFLLHLQIVEKDISVVAGADKAHVIVEPINAAHFQHVALALQIAGVLARVKVVDVNGAVAHCGGKHVAAIAKLNLAAILGGDGLVLLDRVA